MLKCPYKISDLLPHAPPMILIDDVVSLKTDGCTVAVDVCADSRFFEPGKGVPGYVGVEYMAQACGVYAGYLAKKDEQPVRVGYLLGTRNFACETAYFSPGARLQIEVTECLRDENMGVFRCSISDAQNVLATAQLSVYQPPQNPPGQG